MVVVQSMKKNPTMKKIFNFAEQFIKLIRRLMKGYTEGRVLFDQHLEHSLKNNTREKWSQTKDITFQINDDMNIIKLSLKELLSSIKKKCKKRGKKEHAHEEADTQIPLHVLGIVRRSSIIKVDVWSPDTDVLILLMDLVAHAEQRLHAVNLLTGKGTKYRTIDVLESVNCW